MYEEQWDGNHKSQKISKYFITHRAGESIAKVFHKAEDSASFFVTMVTMYIKDMSYECVSPLNILF